VDVTRFRHTMGEGIGAWRDEHVIPAYNGAAVKKFAFCSRPAPPPQSKRAGPGEGAAG
jgi:hypothetical protein